MSAYICDKNHFVYLVHAATHPRLNPHGGSFSYYHKTPEGLAGRTPVPSGDYQAMIDAAAMLLLENITSVSYRYPGDKSSAKLPGPTGESFDFTPSDFARMQWHRPEPVQVMKAIACLSYQSCEHPGWQTSEAHSFLRALEQCAIRALPGYDDAEWGAPTMTKANA